MSTTLHQKITFFCETTFGSAWAKNSVKLKLLESNVIKIPNLYLVLH